MKLVFIILSIAVMIQVSLAAATGNDVRTKENFVIFQKRVEGFITKSESAVLDIIEKLEAKLDDKSKCTECEAFEPFLETVRKHKAGDKCTPFNVVAFFKVPLITLDADESQPPKAYNLFKDNGYSLQDLLDEKDAIEQEYDIFGRVNNIRDCRN